MKIIQWLLKHIVVILAVNIVFLASFHCRFFDVTGVYFYDGIFRLLVTIILVEGVAGLLRKQLKFDYKDICLSVVSGVFITFTILALILVSLDRSYSVFLLCYMNDHYNTQYVSKEEMEEIMDGIFIGKYGMLQRRFDEQVVSGNIAYDSKREQYILTDRGEKMVWLFKMIGNAYGVDDKYINP